MAMIEGIAPHPSSWRALVEQLEQERAGRKLAEALLEKTRGELEEEQKARIYYESLDGVWKRELEGARKRIATLEKLVLEAHRSLSAGEAPDEVIVEVDQEGARIHGCEGGACSAWHEFNDDNKV